MERSLRREQHLSEEQIRLCYDYATEEWPFRSGTRCCGVEVKPRILHVLAVGPFQSLEGEVMDFPVTRCLWWNFWQKFQSFWLGA